MQGAREFAKLFSTGQYERLYVVSGEHARGKTFHIYVLPEGVNAISNGRCNPCLNNDAVEVYGILGGQNGWTEYYGWLHQGKWQQDFADLCDRQRQRIEKYKQEQEAIKAARANDEINRKAALLSTY